MDSLSPIAQYPTKKVEERLNDYQKLQCLLYLIGLLSKGERYTVKQLEKRLGRSSRSLYRYMNLLKDCGFRLESDSSHHYWIAGLDEIYERIGQHFTAEEATLLRQSIASLHSSHPLRDSLMQKLYAHSELKSTGDLIYDQMLGRHLEVLRNAMQQKQRVRLIRYHSLSSNTTADRKVEPLSFAHNMQYLMAYDCDIDEFRQFKVERIGEVCLLKENFNPELRATSPTTDAFGMNGEEDLLVQLQLTDRAAQLLGEEFPLAKPSLCRKGRGYFWQGNVKAYQGVGRFVLGLPGEVKPLATEDFIRYLREQRNHGNF